MTPEGRRRKAKAIRARAMLARDNIEIAERDLNKLCSEMGIRSPTQRSTSEALRAARVSVGQLDLLVAWLSRASVS